MAAPVVALAAKKVAAILLTDKRTWTAIGAVIGGIFVFIILAVTVIFGGISAHNTAVQGGDSDMTAALETLFSDSELPSDLPAEYRDGIENIRGMMISIETEITNQGLDTDPVKAQVIALCLLSDKVNAPPYDDSGGANFYADYVSCFAGTADNGQIFDNIAAKFGIEISADDRTEIIELYENAKESIPTPTENYTETQPTLP
jgi:hypothetical protein